MTSDSSDHSVSQYIDGLRQGDDQANQKIWERFYERLIRLASKKLKDSPRRVANEEDVVAVAFADFFKQVEHGRFPKLSDRHDLWQVLCMLVGRRAVDQMRHQTAEQRGGGDVGGESVWIVPDQSQGPGIGGVPDAMQPTPELAVEMSEIVRERLKKLENSEHRQVALLKLQGFTNREIVDQMQSSLRTVERWLADMRESWSTQQDDESTAA